MSEPPDEKELILPDALARELEPQQPATERSREREREDESYIPVIVKRTDEATRHPDDTLESAIHEGLEQLNRPAFSLFLSAVAGGLIVGFSAMAVGVVTTALEPYGMPMLTRLATAAVYPMGFVVCIMSGAQLYTEHTATAVYPVLDRRASLGSLIQLWLCVIAGNLAGALLIALLLTAADEVIGARVGYIEIGHHLTHYPTGTLLTSAMLAGWLMAMGAWLVLATSPRDSAIRSIYIVTGLIGIGGLHHSIAGSAEMFTAMMLGDSFLLSDAARFIGVALLGNMIGGVIFVGILNYAHIRRTQTTS